jgi:transposase
VPSPKLVPLVLSDAERASLVALSRKRTASQALAERARVVLACAEQGGVMPLTRVAEQTGLSRESVRKWRVRFLEGRLDALGDLPRPGAARKITDEQVEVLVTRALNEEGPGRDSHWSTRTMAAETGLSQSSVSRIWRAFGLRPHTVETWKLSTDPEFIAKVRDVVGLYMSPPEHALVLAVDEKSQIQALDRTAAVLPMLPATPERRTHDYVRHGTASLFAAYDLASGSVIAQSWRRHGHQELLRSSSSSTPPSRRTWTCAWSWTTTPLTRPPRSRTGCSSTPGSTCTSPRPAAPGSTWSSGGSPSWPTASSAGPRTAA